jgi:peptidoglycan/xylan/chitin deacetylase (PgdA/CDA1 family)
MGSMSSITLFRERLRTRSLRYGAYRLLNIFKNYGFTRVPFSNLLDRYVEFLNDYTVRPTFPVTALALHRHPDLFKKLQDRGVEFAIHGYRHVDYTQLEPRIIRSHLEKAVQIFKQNGIQYQGFRFPFLRRNLESTRIVSEFDFGWESSEVIAWPIPELPGSSQVRLRDIEKLLFSYQVKSAGEQASVPWPYQGCLEIPVSMPDDDLLIERLHVSQAFIRTVWRSMLESSRERNELLVLQMHPERFFAFRSALRDLIHRARRRDIWIASLREVSGWWQERARLRVDLIKKRGGWLVAADGNSMVAFEIGKNGGRPGAREWRTLNPGQKVESQSKPVIGLTRPAPHEMIDILNQEGYLFEKAGNTRYSLLLNDTDLKDRESLVQRIEQNIHPLIRKKRWPRSFQSSLSVTGDIDGIDFWDYWTRFYGK